MTVIPESWYQDRAPQLFGVGSGYISPVISPHFIATDFTVDDAPEQIIWSADGVTWGYGSFPEGFGQLRMAVKGANAWIVVSEQWEAFTPLIARTVNLTDWTTIANPRFQMVSWSATYGAGTFVIGGTDDAHTTGKFMYSTDEGFNWTLTGRGDNRENVTIAYGNSLFLAVTPSSVASSGSDLIIPPTEVAAASVQTSSDGITWSSATFPASLQNVMTTSGAAGNWNRVRYLADGKFWLVGYEPAHGSTVLNGIFAHSTDGTTWTQISTGITQEVLDIAYDGIGHYVAPTHDTSVLISSNGTTWTKIDIGATTQWKSVAYHNGRFVIAGDDVDFTQQALAYSDDNGATWTFAVNPIGFGTGFGGAIINFQDVEFG